MEKNRSDVEELIEDLFHEEGNKWNEQATTLLLSTRLDMEKQFNRPHCKKNKLWSQISNVLKEKGYNFDGDKCCEKFRNLLKTYKNNKAKKAKSGEAAINWIYFEKFDVVYGVKANINPPKELLGSSQDTFNDESINDKSNATPNKKIKANKEYFIEKLSFKKADSERKSKKWNEKKELEQKRLEAISDLTEALKEYNRAITTNT